MSNQKSRMDLKKVEIGTKVTSVKPKCFTACYGVNDVRIPANVTVIGADAFRGIAALSAVTFEGRTKAEVDALIPNIADIGIVRSDVARDKDGVAIAPSKTMKVVYEDGTEYQQGIGSSGLTRKAVLDLNHRAIESLDLGDATTNVQTGAFLDCDKLVELVMDAAEAEYVAGKVGEWSLGINCEGATHLVVVYCRDGVVVVNDADSSSGELGLRIDWDKFARMLEDYPDMAALPPVGTTLIVPYRVDADDENSVVDTSWDIIGYNTSIPEYVKYKNGETRIYVSSVANGLLHAIAAGDAVYVKSASSEYSANGQTVASVGAQTFTYGNNCTWSAPTSVTVDGVEYAFAGYNCTIMAKYALGAKKGGTFYSYPQFDSHRNNYGQNDWSTSMLRSWMNGTGDTSRLADQEWQTVTWSGSTTNVPAMPSRMTDEKFMRNVMKAVNRTWVHADWRSGKTLDGEVEHVVDRFWTLGVGAVNCSGSNTDQYFRDQNYDTTKYSDVFNETDIWQSEKSRARRAMKEDGIEGSPCTWWLRSAHCDNSCTVGYVYNNGNVTNYNADNYYGVLPACTIG